MRKLNQKGGYLVIRPRVGHKQKALWLILNNLIGRLRLNEQILSVKPLKDWPLPYEKLQGDKFLDKWRQRAKTNCKHTSDTGVDSSTRSSR